MCKKILQLKNPKGFVILFAVIISTIIMVISFGIVSVAIKSSSLSATSREALTAFYAADSGVECALSVVSYIFKNPSATSGTVPCGASTISLTLPLTGPLVFNAAFPDSGTCTQVEINQTVTAAIPPATNPSVATAIYSRGFNLCSSTNPQVTNPKLLERVLEVSFDS